VEAYLDIFVIYIAVCGLTQLLFKKLERRFGKRMQAA
jgi:ABC-type amino acid transport system permease subunit